MLTLTLEVIKDTTQGMPIRKKDFKQKETIKGKFEKVLKYYGNLILKASNKYFIIIT